MKKKLLAIGVIGVLMASMLVGCGQRKLSKVYKRTAGL